MIKLKSGIEVEYNKDFDVFFYNLIDSIIHESQIKIKNLLKTDFDQNENDLLLKEIMDNCIYVTHQIFQMSKDNENLSKFLITGCLFNCAVLTIQNLNRLLQENSKDERSLH